MRGRLWLLAAAFWLPALGLCRLRAFPLDDDWAYSEPVRRWLSGGGLRLSDWGAPTLLGHLAWGALFSLPAGFSYEALRLSTLVLSFAGLLAFARALRRLGASEAAALAACLMLLLNPLYYSLSFSYMTDVPCLAWMLLSALGYLAAEQDGSPAAAWAGSLAGAAAYLVRQTGLCVPAVAGARLLWRRERDGRAYARTLLAPALAVGFHAWWLSRHGPPLAVRQYAWAGTLAHLADAPALLRDSAARVLGGALYVSLFCAPWTLGLLPRALKAARERRALLACTAAACALALALGARPLTGNFFGPLGVGVCTADACAAKPAGPLGLRAAWLLFDALSLLSGLSLLVALAETPRRAPRGLGLLAGGFLAAFALSLAGRSGFDRYYLVLFPAALAALALGPAPRRAVLLSGLAALAWLSMAGTWDYLAWTQAKWKGCEALVAAGAPPEAVSGGLEWDALQRYERGGRREDWLGGRPFEASVSFSPQSPAPSLARAGAEEYFSPLTLKTERLYLYRAPTGPAR